MTKIIQEKDGLLTVNVEQPAHALYSASSLDRLALCPPSARIGKDIPDRPSKDAERGTRIHELGEILLTGGEPSIVVGINLEELAIAEAYANYVWEVAGEAGIIFVEESFHKELAIYHEHLGGTADAVVIDGRNIHIIDLKSGRSPVSANNNKQMMTYALGALTKHGFDFDNVHLHIYQPNNISHEIYSVGDIKLWSEVLIAIAQRADDPFQVPNPSPKACHFCKAKTICPAIREKVLESAKQDFAPNTLEQQLDEAKLASTWAEAIMEQAKEQILNGANAGKWYLKNGRKMVSYKDKVGAEAFFAENPLAFELKSPSALKKLGIEIPEQYLEEKVSTPSLARQD